MSEELQNYEDPILQKSQENILKKILSSKYFEYFIFGFILYQIINGYLNFLKFLYVTPNINTALGYGVFFVVYIILFGVVVILLKIDKFSKKLGDVNENP